MVPKSTIRSMRMRNGFMCSPDFGDEMTRAPHA
jgi:hypothetical protein